MKYALKLIFLKCIFELIINTAPPASNSVYGREKLFDMTKFIFQIMSVTLVQWSRSCLYVQINRVRLPDTLFCVSLSYRFFLFGLLTLFFLLACFPLFLLLTPLITHLDQYIFKARVRSLILEKGFQKLLTFILAKLTTRKKRSAVKTCPPLKQLNFFLVLVDTMTHNIQYTTNCTN